MHDPVPSIPNSNCDADGRAADMRSVQCAKEGRSPCSLCEGKVRRTDQTTIRGGRLRAEMHGGVPRRLGLLTAARSLASARRSARHPTPANTAIYTDDELQPALSLVGQRFDMRDDLTNTQTRYTPFLFPRPESGVNTDLVRHERPW